MPPSIVKSPIEHLGVQTTTGGTVNHVYEGQPEKVAKYLVKGIDGHYGFPDFPRDRNVGGEFWVHGSQYLCSRVPVSVWTGRSGSTYNWRYNGIMHPTPLSTPTLSGDLSAAAWGPEAFAKMKPTKPEFNFANALYELREVTKSLRQGTKQLSDIGNYHLAFEFGWKPLLQDIANLVIAQKQAQQRLKQLLRDNGRPVRRRVLIYENEELISQSNTVSVSIWSPVLNTYYYRNDPSSLNTTVRKERIWASARFRYWLPEGPRDIRWKKSMLRRLYGLSVSPSVVYNAIPWTWMIDWFTNVGDMVENLDAGVADRLAADYCYVMRDVKVEARRQAQIYLKTLTGKPIVYHGNSWNSAFSKSRSKGTPFGFNVNEASLSSHQLGILGALGLSKLT